MQQRINRLPNSTAGCFGERHMYRAHLFDMCVSATLYRDLLRPIAVRVAKIFISFSYFTSMGSKQFKFYPTQSLGLGDWPTFYALSQVLSISLPFRSLLIRKRHAEEETKDLR